MEFLAPTRFSDYELVDSGGFEKLERFGAYHLVRPEPQAVWNRHYSEKEWKAKAHARFIQKSSASGTWERKREMPDRWHIAYPLDNVTLKFRLALTGFKHVGLFPEQAVNWDFIYRSARGLGIGMPRVLNLFAYTGASSLAARAAGADVTHLDSVKQVVSWARENMELSGLDNIRWLIEDARAYVRRERKRGRTYHGIILDPPAWGHGPDGQKWKLEEQIGEMVTDVTKLLNPDKHFFLLNTYSLGFSPLVLFSLMQQTPLKDHAQYGEVFLPSSSGQKLPLGVFARAFRA